MADRYISKLTTIELEASRRIMAGADFDAQVDKVADQMFDQYMTDNDYMKLLEMYYIRYEKKDNLSGMQFCLLRLQQLNFYKKKRRHRERYPKLSFSPLRNDSTKALLMGKVSLHRQMLDLFIKELLMCDTIITISFMALVVILLHINFYIGFIGSMILYLLIYYIAQYTLSESRVDIHCDSLSKKVDPCLKRLDSSLRR